MIQKYFFEKKREGIPCYERNRKKVAAVWWKLCQKHIDKMKASKKFKGKANEDIKQKMDLADQFDKVFDTFEGFRVLLVLFLMLCSGAVILLWSP